MREIQFYVPEMLAKNPKNNIVKIIGVEDIDIAVEIVKYFE